MAEGIYAKIAELRKVNVPKSRYNAFADYRYRCKEDIYKAIEPVCAELGLVALVDSRLEDRALGTYVVCTVSIHDIESGQEYATSAAAREVVEKKKSDGSQLTGSADTYAEKRAWEHLLLLDSDDDPDAAQGTAAKPKEAPETGPFTAHCASCGTAYQFQSKEHYMGFLANASCCVAPNWQVD